jgi:hypothetical protein
MNLHEELAIALAKYHNHTLPNMTFPTYMGDVDILLKTYDEWVDKNFEMLYDPEEWEHWLFLSGVR